MIPITKISLPRYEELEGDFRKILESGRLTMGPYQKELEECFAREVDVKNAVAVNSCTDGLTIGMGAMGLSGEVITTPFTYVATSHSIVHAGLIPRFVDIDPISFNIDPEKVREELERNENVSAILPVHIFGQPCDIEGLWKVAKEYGIRILWDSAHCGGYSKYKLRKVGGFNDLEVCSLAPTKLITAGEGGIITTQNDELAERCRMLSRLGLPQNIDFQSDERIFTSVGYNARIPEISCLLALKCLNHIDDWGMCREFAVETYKNELDGIGLEFQEIKSYMVSANFAFPLIVDKEKVGISREELQAELKKKEIETRHIWFFPIITEQNCYIKEYGHVSLLNAKKISEQILCLPLWSSMKEEVILEVCDIIKKILRDKNA